MDNINRKDLALLQVFDTKVYSRVTWRVTYLESSLLPPNHRLRCARLAFCSSDQAEVGRIAFL